MEKYKIELIDYRISRAKEAIKEADVLITSKKVIVRQKKNLKLQETGWRNT